MTRQPFDDPRLTAVGLLAETFAGLHAKLSPTLTVHGLSPMEFEVLLRLGRSPGRRLRMTDLAAQADLSASGVTRVVDRLERSGKVRRETCASDRRGWFAVLTETGWQALATVVPAHVADVERWVTGPLTRKQLAALLEALRAIRDQVRPSASAVGAECEAAMVSCAGGGLSLQARAGDDYSGEVISSG